jgi:hypothetical protein
MALDKTVNTKIFNVLQVIRRVLFSMDNRQAEENPVFFCIVTADVANGFELKQTFHLMDLKKISYGFISQTEYQHRIVQDTEVSPQIIGDREGKHLLYHDITLEDFLTGQIQGRIRMNFQKPEVEKGADIDREVAKNRLSYPEYLRVQGFFPGRDGQPGYRGKDHPNQTAILSGRKNKKTGYLSSSPCLHRTT